MRKTIACTFYSIAVSAGALLLPASASAQPATTFERTEERAPCDNFQPLRQPLFGETHLHTSFSFDAYDNGMRVDPFAAYDFAKGGQVIIPDVDGNQTRPIRLRRPIDFAALTDHAENFAELNVCVSTGFQLFDILTLGRRAFLCRELREETDILPDDIFFQLFGSAAAVETPNRLPLCLLPGVNCDRASLSLWREIQRAAEGAYDRSSACTFTSFVAYEWTGTPAGANLHRNVIYRNERVSPEPISYIESNGANPSVLWQRLRETCTDAGTGCDVLTITHNANLSGEQGRMYLDPNNTDDAYDPSERQRFEPLTELIQHKASSECRFDRLAGVGLGTADELCTFEQRRQSILAAPAIPIPGALDPNVFSPRNFIRNVLKDGLALEQRDGINPFKQGFVAGTDSHNGTPGYTLEDDFKGHVGADDANPLGTGVAVGAIDQPIRDGPGGLAVVWAEENSRDSIFAAMKRRETYATSGTRPVVRFFGGWRGSEELCSRPDAVATAYRAGVPMGGDLPRRVGNRNPRFLVMASKDPGTCDAAVTDPSDPDFCGSDDVPGTDLQRIQIVKGWVDATGQTHEQVFDVAGDPNNGASVDPATCAPTGAGFRDLCTVWEDRNFDPEQHAFYYARILENPTCRWSTQFCKKAGVDPFAAPATCLAQAEAANGGPGVEGPFGDCCITEADDPFFERVIQERAWTSPIWYRP